MINYYHFTSLFQRSPEINFRSTLSQLTGKLYAKVCTDKKKTKILKKIGHDNFVRFFLIVLEDVLIHKPLQAKINIFYDCTA